MRVSLIYISFISLPGLTYNKYLNDGVIKKIRLIHLNSLYNSVAFFKVILIEISWNCTKIK